jgi:hypothetical protein
MSHEWKTGDRIIHPEHGSAAVRFVGDEYIGLRFDEGNEALIRLDNCALETWSETAEAAWRARQEQALQETACAPQPPWPASTFRFETKDEARHYLGSHWEPWFETGVESMVRRLPELFEQAVLPERFPVARDALHGIPANWAQGFHLAWPDARRGVMLTTVIDHEAKSNYLVGLYPFDTAGSHHPLEIERVNVWKSGVEAQIEAYGGEAPITFFDTHFLLARGEYERERRLDFSLVGMAYGARPSTVFELPYTPNADTVSWQTMLAGERGDIRESLPDKIVLSGMSMFIPVTEWDIDDYQFRGPIKDIRPFDDFLGQSGWRLTVTVLRLSSYAHKDFDLDILVTRRAWDDEAPPHVGQDIEGTLWLQGRLLDSESAPS